MISVVIPSYNREKTIIRAIESVINQTYKDMEIIVIDDGSNDNTGTIVSAINDKRVRYIKLEKNMGACYARNYGVNVAVGEYIAFQDSDDEWDSDKLEKQLNYLNKKAADVVFCSFKRHKGGNSTVFPKKHIEESMLHSMLLNRNYISTQTILGKKECFVAEPFDNELPRFQDWDLVIRISKYYKVVHLNEALVEMYIQSDSISNNPLKALKSYQLIRVKYDGMGWLSKHNNADFYYAMGHYAIEAGKPSKKYYINAWCLKRTLKHVIMLILTSLKMEIVAKKFLFNNKVRTKFLDYKNQKK